MALDGVGDYIEIPDGAYTNGTFTVALWFKVAFFQTGGTGGIMDLYSDGGEKNIDIDSNAKTINGFNNGTSISGTTVLVENRWYHAAFTANDTTRFLYLDGALESTDTNVSLIADISSNIRIGDNPSLARDFNGTIDEVIVWNRTLTAIEIKDLYRLKNATYFWKVNATDNSINLNNNESETREFTIGAVVADTCTAPGSGNWAITCSDNCNFDSDQIVPANITATGSGVLSLSANLSFPNALSYVFTHIGCSWNITSGGGFNI